VDAIVARGEDPWTEPIETEATLLFCDISDFTALSSRMRPREIITLLNEYFPLMAACVFAHEGTLEKYIGDALLAVWGVPVMRPDDALRAVRAAIDMQAAIGEWNLRRAEPLSIHVGIASGGVAAGNIGSADYLQLATIGDATNLASRVCGVADAGAVVIDDHTRARIGVTAPDLAFEHLGPTVVKGKREPLALYRARRLG
jgi:adenylate cyclase